MDIGDLLIGSGIGGILLSAVQAVINRKKLGAETASVLTKAAAELVKPLSDRIHELEDEVKKLRTQVRETVDQLEHASSQLDQCQDRERAKDALIAELTRAP